MSHGSGDQDDVYHLDPKEVLSQYSVEWIALRKSFNEVKGQLTEIQAKLTVLDKKLENGEIDEQHHMEMYHEKWRKSTEMIQVKREVEARLYEIQKAIRAANKQLKQLEGEKLRREHVEEEKSGAMIEWMSLKQGFELVKAKRREINSDMDSIEMKRRDGSISDEEYRQKRLEQFSSLAELATVESDVKNRLNELLEIIRK
ncbi:MAG: hypothetical protein ACTSUB_00605 [Candidatus Thorarchaeota archaeon]